MAHLPLPDAPGAMPRDRIQPARKLRRILQLGQALKRQQKGFLGYVLCGLARIQELARDHQDCAAKATHQFVVSLRTAHLRDPGYFFIAQFLESVLQCHASGSSRTTGDNDLRNG